LVEKFVGKVSEMRSLDSNYDEVSHRYSLLTAEQCA